MLSCCTGFWGDASWTRVTSSVTETSGDFTDFVSAANFSRNSLCFAARSTGFVNDAPSEIYTIRALYTVVAIK